MSVERSALNVERSAPRGAVFLSYASQDADTVLRIAEALRAAGLVVWFDKDELTGGDAWDQKIRRQIKECVLFVPIISAATQARPEGYFRLEWKLAVDRSHLMADDAPFLFPVVIDDTNDAAARVPDRFREVQWTRLSVKDTPETLAVRVGKLLGGEAERMEAGRPAQAGKPLPAARDGGVASPVKLVRRDWVKNLSVVGGLLIGLIYAVRSLFVPVERHEKKPAAVAAALAVVAVVPAAPVASEGVKLAQRARALYDKVGFGRDDLALADDFAKRATDADPTVALCWGVRAHVQAAYLFRGFAVGDEFVQRARDAQSFANRALALDAKEVEALLAQGRVATYQRAFTQAEEIFGRALAAHPDDNRIRRALGTMLRLQPKRVAEGLGVLQEAVRRDPRDALAHYDLAVAWSPAWNFSAAWEEYETVLKLQPFGSALTGKASLALKWKGDVAPMRAALDHLAPADRAEDRAVYYAMLCGVLERNPDATSAAAAVTPRDYLEDSAVIGPKAWFLALAYQRAGKDNLARTQWQAADAVVRERMRADPKSERYRVQLALTLAWLDRAENAARELAPIEAAWREQMNPIRARDLARHYAALGDRGTALGYLRQAVNQTWWYTEQDMRLDPFLDKVRDTPEFVALLTSLPKQPPPIVPVPYLGKATPSATAATRDAEQLIATVYGMLTRLNFTKENLAMAEEQTRKATELAPESARAWAARARVHAAYIQRGWDASDKRRQEADRWATRALALDPDEADAIIAQAWVVGTARSEARLRRALELRPADPLIRRLLAGSLAAQRRVDEALTMRRETVRLFPDDALSHYDLGLHYTNTMQEPDLALASFDAALMIEPFASPIIAKAANLAGSRGDFAAARRTLEQLSPADRGEDRAVSFAMWLALIEGDSSRALDAGKLSTRVYFEDGYLPGPKAWMRALALRREGKATLARLEWEAAETAVRDRMKAMPGGVQEKAELCVTLAWLGRTQEIPGEVATLEGLARESQTWTDHLMAAQFYAG
ncbi:MAG: toll/interleukin-1 receptor domain-containing protein [Opitutus sp.]|nr:toll/interleukin-1 receptor domain-containing protein [Opitutus sp.]